MELKKFMGYAAMAALTIGAASCSNEEDFSNAMTDAQELRVNVGIKNSANSVNTKAGITATKFTNKEEIGLYIYKGKGFAEEYPQVGTHKSKNAQYKENAGVWKVATPGQGIVLSDIVGTVYAYYPYAASNDAVEAGVIPVEVKADQGTGLSDGTKDDTQTDYMWATPVSEVSNITTTSVNLSMNHALAMVSFKFVKGDYPGEGLISSIKLMNTKEIVKAGAATMDISNGALTVSGTKSDITIAPNAKLAKNSGDEFANNEIARMLVYPVSEKFQTGDMKVQIVLDGKQYTLPIPVKENADTFVAGQNYQYTFKLAGKEFGNEDDDITVDVVEWKLVEAGGGDLISPDVQ